MNSEMNPLFRALYRIHFKVADHTDSFAKWKTSMLKRKNSREISQTYANVAVGKRDGLNPDRFRDFLRDHVI